VTAVLELDPATYRPHALHSPDRLFQETNCYTDLWIELLHARGDEPLAMLGFAANTDFVGDQWTFVKPPPDALERLYGLEVQEFVVYRPLPEHLERQAELGRTVIVEVDSFYLPDTAGRSYREKHEKSSIAVAAIEPEAERLVYFHGPGLFELEGEDYRNALRVGRPFSDDVLPPYIELVRSDRLPRPDPDALRPLAEGLLGVQVDRRPTTNPARSFGERLVADLPRLQAGDEQAFHEYAFVTARQCGSAWEAAQTFLEWLDDGTDGPYAEAAAHYAQLAASSKTLLFKLARSAATGRELDVEPAIAEIAHLWEEAMGALVTGLSERSARR
jgi:uncharacterized protein DUF1839